MNYEIKSHNIIPCKHNIRTIEFSECSVKSLYCLHISVRYNDLLVDIIYFEYE